MVKSVGGGLTESLMILMILLAILSNMYFLLTFLDMASMIYFMLYVNARQPVNVVEFYNIFKNFQYPFIPNIFLDFIDENYI